MSERQFDDAMTAAGVWFIGAFIEYFLIHYNEIIVKNNKTKLIENIYNGKEYNHDSKIEGTRTRVNSLLRIIRYGKTIEALEYIVNSNKMKLNNPILVEKSRVLLEKIKENVKINI